MVECVRLNSSCTRVGGEVGYPKPPKSTQSKSVSQAIQEGARGAHERRKSWKRGLRFAINCYMKRDEAISRLRQHEADLKRLGVEHL
jgi:hypothetical protein